MGNTYAFSQTAMREERKMLSKLRIENFKGWKDTDYIQMAPITLFFGTNSSGKSSISQFLMMLKQTVESSDRKMVFYPGGKNTAVDLGSYQEMVFHRNPENKISFYYQWDLKDKLRIKDSFSKRPDVVDTLTFKAKVGLILKNPTFPNVDVKKDTHENYDYYNYFDSTGLNAPPIESNAKDLKSLNEGMKNDVHENGDHKNAELGCYSISQSKYFIRESPIGSWDSTSQSKSSPNELTPREQPLLVVDKFEYQLINNTLNNKINVLMSIGMERLTEKKSEYKVNFDENLLKRKQGCNLNLSAPINLTLSHFIFFYLA